MSLENTTERLRLERDLYRRLLELGTYDDPRPFLRDALELVVGVTGARRGFLSVGGDDRAPAAFLASGFDDEEIARIQAQVSGGIIAQAISTGRTVHSDSALVDPRFSAHQSVQLNRISAVLCAPIGEDRPLGVVYLQDRTADGASVSRTEKMSATAPSCSPATSRRSSTASRCASGPTPTPPPPSARA